MSASQPLAPPVVSVTVVHDPGAWFDETLRALAAQDYSSLRHVFLVTGVGDSDRRSSERPSFDDVDQRIRAVLPDAFVRPVAGNPGFGPVANEILRLVEGDGGLFLVCHDDVALSRSAVRTLVTELMRSNAGIVGPKLVDWDEPRRLQHVGLGLDRFGEVDPVIDDGEFDQEQHDAVSDVFVLPTACLLVRADLFRSLGGFDPAISFHGDDVDLCWRAHLTGARVVVVPDAKVRHRERLPDRRPDLSHRALAARHRMRSVVTLTGSSRLAVRLVQLVLLTLAELVVGLFTGRFGEAWASLRALVGLVPRSLSIFARRRVVRPRRIVPEREILAVQARGSARLNSFVRSRETATFVGTESTVRRWREVSFGPVLAWFLVVLGVVVGSRSFIRNGVPPVGEFLELPLGPSDLWTSFRSGFDGRGVGRSVANPTGWALSGVLGVVALGRMALLSTVSVVGSSLVGALGVWRLLSVFPLSRARVVGLVVYVGSPMVPFALGVGDRTLLVWYAALPWMLHLTSRAAGLAAADPTAARSADGDGLVDGLQPVGRRDVVRLTAALALVTAVAAAFVPPIVVAWPVAAALVGVATLLARGSIVVAARFVGAGVVSAVSAVVLNLPWSASWDGGTLWSPVSAARQPRDLVDILSLTGSDGGIERLGAALVIPLLVAVAVARAWRLTWAVRGLLLTAVFGAALVASESGLFDRGIPDRSLLLVPVALGWAIGAAALVEGTGSDVLEQGFGWRQPVAVAANLAVVVGLVPGVMSIGDGAWGAPPTPLPGLIATQFPVDAARGDHRVLYVGDARLIPVPSREYAPGIAVAVTDAGPLDATDADPQGSAPADETIDRALDLMSTSSTLRVGRLLAPLGIRYIVVPETDGLSSTDDRPLPVADGLVESLQNQLDIGAVYGLPSLRIFENLSWIPVAAVLTGSTAEASDLAGEDVLARSDLSRAVAAMPGLDAGEPSGTATVPAGVLHVAIPFDDRLELRLDGVEVPPRPGFGITTAFDIERPGTAVLTYRSDPARTWWIAAQALLWTVVALLAASPRSPFGRGRTVLVRDETLIDLDLDVSGSMAVPGEVLATAEVPAALDGISGDEPTGHEAPGDDSDDDGNLDGPPPASTRPGLVVEPPRVEAQGDDDSLATLVTNLDRSDEPGDIDWDDIDRDLGLPPGGRS